MGIDDTEIDRKICIKYTFIMFFFSFFLEYCKYKYLIVLYFYQMNNLTTEEIMTIKNIFNKFDSDNNGFINQRELQALTIVLNDPLSPAELHDFFKSIDTDNSGKITWNEFIAYWKEN